jgi:TonB family protein
MQHKLLLLIISIIALSIDGFTQNDKPRFAVYGASDTVYITPDVMPKFPGGDEGLLEYLDEVAFPLFFMEYLVLAEEGDWEGTVYIEFVINKDGTVSNAAISGSTGYGPLDTAGLQHVQGMPNWKPGKQNGKPVKVQKVVAVQFYYYDPPPPPPPPPPPLLPYDEIPIVDDTPVNYLDDYVFSIVEEMPEFPGGDDSLMEYLKKVPYVPITRENDIEGTAYIQFVIEKDGSVSEVMVIRTSGHVEDDLAALEHVKAMPQWKPGYRDGKPVRVQYVVPVKCNLP